MQRVLGIIPARGGSKGVPQKNVRLLCGRPLICYTIDSALKSSLLTKVIVSTDSLDISDIAKNCGADVPCLRPAELATDSALAIDVIRHALEFVEQSDGVCYDYVVMLQPTSPLKLPQDINSAIEKLIRTGCDSVVTVADVGADHPARMYRIEGDRMISIVPEGIAMRPRQELSPIYIRNGAVYACRRDVIERYGSLLGRDVRPLVMPKQRSVNIDDLSDFSLAEYYLRAAGHC